MFAFGNRDKDLQLIQRHTTIPCDVGARDDHLVKANELYVSIAGLFRLAWTISGSDEPPDSTIRAKP